MKGTEVQCRLHVTDVLTFLESIVFRDHGDIRKAGWGSSPWKHPHESQKKPNKRKTEKTNKTQTKNSGRVHSLTRVYFFLLNVFFFKAVFESFACGLDFSVTILISKLNIQSHRKQMFMPHKWRQKEQKRHCIFTPRSLGPLFSRSPHSLHTRVSHGSVFLWSDMISKLLILLLQFKYLSVCKYISLIILTRLIGSGPLRLELEASLLLSICVINYIFFTKICHVKTVFVSVFVSQYFSS